MNRGVARGLCLALMLLVPTLPSVGLTQATPAAGLVGLEAPDTVDPGQVFAVTLSGGPADGRLEIWGPVTGAGPGGPIASTGAASGTVDVTAPGEPGSYELRFVSAAGAVLARTVVDVAAVPVSLSIGRAIGAGIDNPFGWRGPGSPGDMIQIYDPVTGAVVAEAPAVGAPGAANVTIIRAPERYGDYQLRYWSAAKGAVLRVLPIFVGQGTAWLRSPTEVFVDEKFDVEWNGPVGENDAFELVEPATDSVLARVPASVSGAAMMVSLTAPARPGAYRVRYVNLATGFVYADLPLDVDRK